MITVWPQLTHFTSRLRIQGLSNHFYSENFEIQGNLCLLTLGESIVLNSNLKPVAAIIWIFFVVVGLFWTQTKICGGVTMTFILSPILLNMEHLQTYFCLMIWVLWYRHTQKYRYGRFTFLSLCIKHVRVNEIDCIKLPLTTIIRLSLITSSKLVILFTLDLSEFNVNVMTQNNGTHQRSPYDSRIQKWPVFLSRPQKKNTSMELITYIACKWQFHRSKKNLSLTLNSDRSNVVVAPAKNYWGVQIKNFPAAPYIFSEG